MYQIKLQIYQNKSISIKILSMGCLW